MKKTPVLSLLLLAIVAGTAFAPGPDRPTKESLGKMLFFDPILSEDSSVSCASCHKPEFAFADTTQFSQGVHGRIGGRNTPSAMNMDSREAFFWDGRAVTLEQQALGPIENPLEMNLPANEAVKRLSRSPRYRSVFHKVFKQYPNKQNLAQALAAFERTLETSNTPNDRWLNDEPHSMSEQQIRGREVFRTKVKCLECHFSPDFTGDEFRSIGLFNGRNANDSGRYAVTKSPADLGKMKVPGLRNVAITAPYMHNGSFKTLREVIDYYDNPVLHMPDGLNRDSLLLHPLGLTEVEKQDLEAFLHALTDDQFVKK
ncbi:cytochrome-c peroxidase [Polluticoccus soli]|uniref:cytochrome-c peroxidase n=1 Tax=Polluticoccus soli TaxID=3034150 RepID=UPI0023E34696|nr:cytochrome c peroxidase [Flavipsychrobacter sp. JY13-12]